MLCDPALFALHGIPLSSLRLMEYQLNLVDAVQVCLLIEPNPTRLQGYRTSYKVLPNYPNME